MAGRRRWLNRRQTTRHRRTTVAVSVASNTGACGHVSGRIRASFLHRPAASDESARIPVQRSLHRIRHSRARRRRARQRRRGGRRGHSARRHALGRQGAGARGRPRQGRRRQARARSRRGARGDRPACSARASSPSRPVPEGLPIERVYVESGSDIEREIYLSPDAEPRARAHRGDRLGRGRHGHRGGRRARAGEDPHA